MKFYKFNIYLYYARHINKRRMENILARNL